MHSSLRFPSNRIYETQKKNSITDAFFSVVRACNLYESSIKVNVKATAQCIGTPHAVLRSASANLLSVTRCNLSFGTRGFRTAAPTIWNSLPANVRSCATLSTFRRHLKSHLFQSSFPTAKPSQRL